MSRIGEHHRVAALVGDLATENDAARLKRATPQVKQITTGTVCHLDAQMVQKSLADGELISSIIYFIENVGNLVCPSSYDLGENLRFVLLSAIEGEDKPLKYPTIFNTSDISHWLPKWILPGPAAFDLHLAHLNIQNVRPGMRVFEVSAKTEEGMAKLTEFIRSQRKSFRIASAV